MTEQEKEVLAECLTDAVKCSSNLVYESLSILFENMAKHPELNLQQVLVAIAAALKMLAKEDEKGEQK